MNHPIDYARVVKAIGNEEDITEINLDGMLPSATIMVVSVTGRLLLWRSTCMNSEVTRL